MIRHDERHRADRIGWLRAAVLGANDGIISTASLLVGVAAANGSTKDVLVAGTAGLLAGAMSMAAGEYVSVSSQADTEAADLERERKELAENDASEQVELTQIYISRGLDEALARQVARQLMAHDALGSHARDELGLVPGQRARPVQAALASAALFSVGALLPLASAILAPAHFMVTVVVTASLVFLAGLGALAAKVGGAGMVTGGVRVTFWGLLAMALTYAAGLIFGTQVP